MKAIFLTSSPTGSLDGLRRVSGLDPMNGFVALLRKYWKENARNLMISAFPDDISGSEEMAFFFDEALQRSDFSCGCFDLLDRRNSGMSKEELQSYDVIWLGGGHVPTQNRFFREIALKDKLQNYEGIVIGISAGSMNCAGLVYAEPEEKGEAIDPFYERFLPGLGLTSQMILPHYQMVRGKWIDGMRLYEDIIFPDSKGRQFLNLPDGSFLLIAEGKETVYGEAYMISDGCETQICKEESFCLLRTLE